MALNNSLVKQETNQEKKTKNSLTVYMTSDAVKNQINNILGGKDGQRFISAVISAINTNPQLAECSNGSIVSSALLGESLKLSPSPQLGHYYLVPYKSGSGKVAQFQLGYKGYIQLATRSGQYKKLNVLAIKKGELIRFDPLNEEIEVKLIDDELERENAETIGYYAMFEYTNGFRKAIYWSKKKMENHARTYSYGYRSNDKNSYWIKDFDSMAFKTMLRQLISKWGIMSIDFQKAFESDMGVIGTDGAVEYVDNVPDSEIVEAVEATENNSEVIDGQISMSDFVE